MYYDVRNHVGTVLGADMLTPAPGYEGKVRLHADVLQQIDEDRFRAQDAFVTSSRLGIPRYRLQMGEATFDDRQTPHVDLAGEPGDRTPRPDQPPVDHQELVAAQNNLLYIEDVPIFYWPTFATDLNDPSFFIRRVQFKEDGVFGYQLFTDWAAYQLLGIKDRPEGTDWTVSLNYLSYRGLSEGTEFLYRPRRFSRHSRDRLPGRSTSGAFPTAAPTTWARAAPASSPSPTSTIAIGSSSSIARTWARALPSRPKLGKISDRNFLQEYFKQDWDEQKDPTTDVELKFRRENMSMSLLGQARLDNFVTETQWLPRFDHYLLGQSLVDDRLTWFEHTSLGYAQFKVGTLPSAAAGDEAVSHLPWEPQNFSGGRFVSRNEIDLPVELGPVKIVPYLLGELGYWGEDINGQPLTRAYYQAGIRATLPMWAVDSEAESALVERARAGPQGRVPGGILARPGESEHDAICRSTIRWTTSRSRISAAASRSTRSVFRPFRRR